jgi:hypothetical protein
MQDMLFKKIRLSWYFFIFLCIYLVLAFTIPKMTFEGGTLTLFSVNSFLYGFYLAPILSAQKTRVDELHRLVRSEANAIFAMMLHIKKLPDHFRNELQGEMMAYLHTVLRQRKVAQGEAEYEELISDCLKYDGKHQETVDKLLDGLITNEQNRTQFSMQLGNKVFSHEWMVIMVLFSITIGFVLFLDGGDSLVLKLVTAFLCTGLTMLLIILAKLSSLTHKRAKQIWDPYKKLVDTHFYRID